MNSREVGVYEAKTRLPGLLDEVEQGNTITITRHGKPVARLVPIRRQIPLDDVIAAIRAFRAEHPLNGLSIRDLIDEGRR